MYSNDNDASAPQHTWYSDFAGVRGNHIQVLPEDRPLNTYLGNGAIAECPSDKGDSWKPEKNTHIFTNHGSSYHAPWYGAPFNSSTIIGTGSLKTISFIKPSYKGLFFSIIVSSGREWAVPQSKWHHNKKPLFPISFADGSARVINFEWKLVTHSPPRSTMDWMIDNLGYY